MKFLSNMKLSRMIMIVAVVPIFAMLIFSTQLVLRGVERSNAMGDLGQLTALAVKMSNLVHEQQKERGVTAVYVGSSGAKFASELASQRQQTDKKREELESFHGGFSPEKYGEKFNQGFQAVIATLGKMDGIRKRVDALTISAPEAIGYYTGLNSQNLSLIELMGSLSPDTVIFSRFVGFSNFLQSKERAGIERAVGANGFATGKFAQEAMNKFKRLILIQETYSQVFLTQATDEQKALFNKVMSSDVAKEVQRMREVAFSGGLQGGLQGITGKMWFDMITQKINGLKGIEDSLSLNLLDELAIREAAAVSSKWYAIGTALFALVLVVGLCFLIIHSINGSFRTIISAMTKLADGNLDVSLPPVKPNEIGDMINCVQVFKDNALEKVGLEKEQKAKHEVEEKRQAVISEATANFDASIGGIVETVSSAATELNSTAQSMASISEETSSQATAVAAASEEASANVQTVASAAEEMSASISEINTQVAQASAVSKQAVENVEKTSRQMEELAQTADKVGEVVSMISDIAEQTNLLALNATIESARAGEAGKGFAVVASEVKALANETAKATEEIAEHIQKIQAATKGAVVSIDDIGTVVKQLEETSTAIAAAMEEQGATTQEISRNVTEAATGTQEVSSSISSVTQASQEAGAASGEVTSASGELSQQAELMKTEVDKFLQQVRAA